MKVIGPLHDVNIKFVTKRTLRRHWGKAENVLGLYDPDKNTIFVAKDQEPQQLLQCLFHELIHAAEDQCGALEEEARADVLGSWLIKLFKVTSTEEVIHE